MIVRWNKEDCPFCGQDGKVWEWNQRGGQSYVKCNHLYEKETLVVEAKELIHKIAKLQYRQKEIREMLETAIEED